MLEVLNLNENNCADCYKCIRTCPVKAITYANNTAEIVHDECILCGNCFVSCPQKAKQVRNDVLRVKAAIAGGKRVVCSVAPSFIADFRIQSVDVLEKALKSLGFSEVQETAVGAQMVSDEYARIMREGKQRIIISSCCPSINTLIQKYHPSMLPYLAKVLTPMQAHCKAIKEQTPDAFTVFIGPCIAKKAEADGSPYTDVALTYDELREWLAAEHIELPTDHVASGDGKLSRLYPATGGVLKATDKVDGYRRIAIDGVDNCRAVFDELDNGAFGNVFIEMSACEGSCINGPCIREHTERRLKGALRVATYGGEQRFDAEAPNSISCNYPFLGGKKVKFGAEAINDMLYKMGKTSPEKELNCGSCGYPTCREKAIAILEGKAKIEMCLPFLKEKAESFSDSIINNTPNAILVLDEDLVVQQINRAAVKMFKLKDAGDILHEHVVRILNPGDYQNIITSALHTTTRKHFLADYQLYVEETILYDRQYHIVISIMRDVTEQETLRGQDAELRKQTVEITDKVIEKQMRVVQEIASLLGETTAETKIALTKLKDAMSHE
ncbi:MAG: PAS domain-containing protein [Clostridiales bacterium]|nr:PAS domain-containing protein [Clostridiales bacterium]MDY4008223.1 [Fe-Fe] hydrogenase large subunit C-terminal domain-containing protein [Candidatus Limiplasma sp.]